MELDINDGGMRFVGNFFSKIEKLKKKSVVIAILFLLLGVFISGLFQEIFGIILIRPIIEPIEKYWNPPLTSIVIDPIPDPELTNKGTHVIKVNLVNNGTTVLDKIWIDYRLKCTMNNTKRAFLESKTMLLPQDNDFFEFETSGLNTSCAINPQPVVFKFYKDKLDREYLRVENVTSRVCMYCPLEINITAINFFYNYSYWYPYFEGELTLSGGVVSGFIPYENAQNKSELIYFPERDVGMMPFDMSTACLRGEDPVWCRQYFGR